MLIDAKTKPICDPVVVRGRGRAAQARGKICVAVFSGTEAKLILYAAQGLSNDEVAVCLDTRREVVSLWRKRFFTDRLAGLEEHARPGRPRTFSP